ncbi:MAG: hypothetical protein ABL893_07030, partial [Hyphomicrobium sp.]
MHAQSQRMRILTAAFASAASLAFGFAAPALADIKPSPRELEPQDIAITAVPLTSFSRTSSAT